MKLTRNWLEDYVDIPINTEDLCHQLTMAGLEVDNISLVDNDELIEANWYSGKELPNIPPEPSLSNLLIKQTINSLL